MATSTPLPTTVTVPLAVSLTVACVAEVAVVVKGRLPVALPGCGVNVRETSRKLLAPGGTSTDVTSRVAVTIHRHDYLGKKSPRVAGCESSAPGTRNSALGTAAIRRNVLMSSGKTR